MATWYKMQELSGIGNNEDRRTYPRMDGGRVVSTDELAEHMCEESTFNPAEVKGMIAAMSKHMAYFMRNGNRVKVEGVGTFSASLGLTDTAEPETADGSSKRNARSVRVRSILYRPDKELIDKTNTGIKLIRSPYKPRKSSTRYTPEERLERALAYLDTEPFLTPQDYRGLTGLCITPAREELRRWAQTEGSGITTKGLGTHKVYVKRTK